MKADEYAWSGSITFDTKETGYLSRSFTNKSNYKTVTYVAIEVLDGDYYECKVGLVDLDALIEKNLDPVILNGWLLGKKSVIKPIITSCHSSPMPSPNCFTERHAPKLCSRK